jgi:hypothetical protein
LEKVGVTDAQLIENWEHDFSPGKPKPVGLGGG